MLRTCQNATNHLLGTFKLFSRCYPDTFLTPFSHPQDIFHRTSILFEDTFQTPFRHLLNTSNHLSETFQSDSHKFWSTRHVVVLWVVYLVPQFVRIQIKLNSKLGTIMAKIKCQNQQENHKRNWWSLKYFFPSIGASWNIPAI